MAEYIFVDENHVILTDEQARDALKRTNDSQYLSDGQGVVKVPKERWNVAQSFERNYWLEQSVGATEDRNEDHRSNFDGYSAVRQLHFSHAIELGCGPFTNLRLIAGACRVDSCTLLDPLAGEYQKHPNHTYDDRRLKIRGSWLDRLLAKNVLLRAARRVLRRFWPGSLTTTIPVKRLLACPIEEMPLDCAYDLIVIINVIEHCFDIDRVFENILRIAKPGAVLIFADRYYDHATVAPNGLRGLATTRVTRCWSTAA